MVKENFRYAPSFEEFTMRRKLMEANAWTVYQLEAEWKNEINGMYQVVEHDRKAGYELINEYYQKKMYSFSSQKSYDEVASHYYKVLFLTREIYIQLKRYCADLRKNIEDLEKNDENICPCCGRRLDEYFLESLREQLEDAEDQLLFYETFIDFRQGELNELNDRAQKMGFDTEGLMYRRGIESWWLETKRKVS